MSRSYQAIKILLEGLNNQELFEVRCLVDELYVDKYDQLKSLDIHPVVKETLIYLLEDDVIEAKNILRKYDNIDDEIVDFLSSLINACENYDKKALESIITDELFDPVLHPSLRLIYDLYINNN